MQCRCHGTENLPSPTLPETSAVTLKPFLNTTNMLKPRIRLLSVIVPLALCPSLGAMADAPANGPAANALQQQNQSIAGTVLDEKGEPVIGATVMVKGSSTGAVTDIDGHFTLRATPGATLEVTYVGYNPVTVKAQRTMTIHLRQSEEALNEVVVVGYGTMKKENLTGAVDKVTSKSLEAVKFNNMGDALQGQIPNLNIDIADGKPGRAASFNIRGTTSINGGSPLIVIDGVPSDATDLNNLAPQDVDEISVLKDASSSAIYGARAAYGVILITTKRSKKGDFSFTYTNNFTWSADIWKPDVYMNATDYLDILENEFCHNIGQVYYTEAQLDYAHKAAADPTLPNAQLTTVGGKQTLLIGGRIHNYYREWFRDWAPSQNHHFSLKGGGDKLTYMISGDYNHEEGALKFKPEKVNRLSLRSNITYQLNSHVKFYNNTNLLRRKENMPNEYLYNFCSNVYRFIDNTNPMLPEKVDVNGEMVNTDIGFYRDFLTHQSELRRQRHGLSTTLGTDITFFGNDLRIHADITYRYSNLDYYRWWDNKGPYISHNFNNRNTILNYYSDASPNKVIRSDTNTKFWNANAYATYDKTLGAHHFTVMAGMTRENYDMLYNYGEHQGVIEGIGQHSFNLATGNQITTDNDDRNVSQSTFGRVNYDYLSRYLIEFNGCYNQSSKFARGNRGAFFSSVSAGWRVSEEPFFKPLRSVIDNLKLRGSYGELGNQNIGSYDYLSTFSFAQSSFAIDGNHVTYTSTPSPKSKNFTWEKSRTFDVGFDLVMLDSRLSLTFDWYQRDTKNMLAKFHSLPSVYGATVPKENVASLRNRGWEVAIGWNDQFKLGNSNFTYGARFNMSDYKSEITDYYNPTNYLGDYYKGQVLGEIWGLKTLGLFRTDEEAKSWPMLETSGRKNYVSAGWIKFENSDGDDKISRGKNTLEDHGDYRIIGNSTPRYQYGITLYASWHGFDINALFRGVGKRDIYPGDENTKFWGPYNRKYQVLLKHVVDNRWTEDNPDAYFPKPAGYIASGSDHYLSVPQTRYLQDASYLRLKSLVFGYTLPKQLLAKALIKNLRVYVSAHNLFTITGLDKSMDPEQLEKDPDGNQSRGNLGIGTAYPVQKSWAFGVELTF